MAPGCVTNDIKIIKKDRYARRDRCIGNKEMGLIRRDWGRPVTKRRRVPIKNAKLETVKSE